jgi:hypothetical protein
MSPSQYQFRVDNGFKCVAYLYCRRWIPKRREFLLVFIMEIMEIQQPHSVILVNEVEKVYPQVLPWFEPGFREILVLPDLAMIKIPSDNHYTTRPHVLNSICVL